MIEDEFSEDISDGVIEFLGCTALIEAYKNIPYALFDRSEEELEKMVGRSKVARDLRLAFVKAHNAVQLGSRQKITLESLANEAGCSYHQARNLLVGRAEVFAWVLRYVGDSQAQAIILRRKASWRMSEILNLAAINDEGEFNYQLGKQQIEIFKYLDGRLHPLETEKPIANIPDSDPDVE